MKTLHLLTAVCLAVALILLPGCLGKPESYGEGTALFVVADSLLWNETEESLRQTFERVIPTPKPERLFEVIWVPPEKLNEFATRTNLAILGVLPSDGKISRKVTNMLSAAVKEKVVAGSAYVFPKEDPWAKNQLMLVLASNTAAELNQKLTENKEYLYNLLEERLLHKTSAQMFVQHEQKDLSAEILGKYGWTVRIQHDYFEDIDRPQNGFYRLRRSLPGRERWLSVHWLDDPDPSIITEDWILQTRDKIAGKFSGSDLIFRDAQYLSFEEVEFAGRPATRVQGLWENEEEQAGGPFRNYTFFDEDTGRIYMVDIAVFFPAGKKEPFLRQLDVMAQTFRTTQDLQKKDKS